MIAMAIQVDPQGEMQWKLFDIFLNTKLVKWFFFVLKEK